MSNDPLNLRQLPAVEPPEELWDAIEAQLDASDERYEQLQSSFKSPPAETTTYTKHWLPLALAATVSIVAVGLFVLVANSPVVNTPMQPALSDASLSNENPALTETQPSNALLLARQASALLEAQLSRVDSGVIDARHIDDLILLESELGWVDELLIERPSDTRLWQQRVSLLDQMNQRYASNDLQNQMLSMSY